MLRAYFIIAFRVLLRHRFTSAVNILGLSAALAVCALVLAFLRHEALRQE